MPPLDSNAAAARAGDDDGRRVAVAAQLLYLVNLMLAPGLAFLVLAVLCWRHRAHSSALARCHLRLALRASLAGGAAIFATAGVALAAGGQGPVAWVAAVLYFTLVHSSLILLGVLALTKALAGQCWRFRS